MPTNGAFGSNGTQEREIAFDQAVYALGSHIDVDAVPGAAEHAYRLARLAAVHVPRPRCGRGCWTAPICPRASSRSAAPETAIEVAGEIKTAVPL